MSKRPYDLSAASIVELKAELLQKGQEFKAAKLSAQSRPPKKSASEDSTSWILARERRPKADPKAKIRAAITAVECQGSGRPKDEDEEVLAKSRRTLEQKARLYEKLRRGEDDDVSEVVRENILVDFVRKDWDPVGKRFVADEPEQIVRVEKVEFVDEFGRTRLVTVEEHAALVKTKQELANKLIESLKAPTNDEAEEAIAGPAHYDDTQEIRSKGIGFYRFSQSESARQKQLAELNVLRQSTVESRSKAMILKEQRRIVQEARLAKVRERRLRQQQGKDGLHHKDAEEQT